MTLKNQILIEYENEIKKLLAVYTGGESFFNHLDEAIRQNLPLIHLLFEKLRAEYPESHFVLTGAFGQTVLHKTAYLSENDLVVSGNLRKGKNLDLRAYKWKIAGKSYVFVDDSYYSGTTYNCIKNAIGSVGGKIDAIAVCYDGSLKKREDLMSFYRYYDHFAASLEDSMEVKCWVKHRKDDCYESRRLH